MLNHTSIVAPRFLPVVCRCSNPEFEKDCIIGDPTFRVMDFCVMCGHVKDLGDAIFEARVTVNPQFDADCHVLDYVIAKLG